jgi:hypothetical protein
MHVTINNEFFELEELAQDKFIEVNRSNVKVKDAINFADLYTTDNPEQLNSIAEYFDGVITLNQDLTGTVDQFKVLTGDTPASPYDRVNYDNTDWIFTGPVSITDIIDSGNGLTDLVNKVGNDSKITINGDLSGNHAEVMRFLNLATDNASRNKFKLGERLGVIIEDGSSFDESDLSTIPTDLEFVNDTKIRQIIAKRGDTYSISADQKKSQIKITGVFKGTNTQVINLAALNVKFQKANIIIENQVNASEAQQIKNYNIFEGKVVILNKIRDTAENIERIMNEDDGNYDNIFIVATAVGDIVAIDGIGDPIDSEKAITIIEGIGGSSNFNFSNGVVSDTLENFFITNSDNVTRIARITTQDVNVNIQLTDDKPVDQTQVSSSQDIDDLLILLGLVEGTVSGQFRASTTNLNTLTGLNLNSRTALTFCASDTMNKIQAIDLNNLTGNNVIKLSKVTDNLANVLHIKRNLSKVNITQSEICITDNNITDISGLGEIVNHVKTSGGKVITVDPLTLSGSLTNIHSIIDEIKFLKKMNSAGTTLIKSNPKLDITDPNIYRADQKNKLNELLLKTSSGDRSVTTGIITATFSGNYSVVNAIMKGDSNAQLTITVLEEVNVTKAKNLNTTTAKSNGIIITKMKDTVTNIVNQFIDLSGERTQIAAEGAQITITDAVSPTAEQLSKINNFISSGGSLVNENSNVAPQTITQLHSLLAGLGSNDKAKSIELTNTTLNNELIGELNSVLAEWTGSITGDFIIPKNLIDTLYSTIKTTFNFNIEISGSTITNPIELTHINNANNRTNGLVTIHNNGYIQDTKTNIKKLYDANIATYISPSELSIKGANIKVIDGTKQVFNVTEIETLKNAIYKSGEDNKLTVYSIKDTYNKLITLNNIKDCLDIQDACITVEDRVDSTQADQVYKIGLPDDIVSRTIHNKITFLNSIKDTTDKIITFAFVSEVSKPFVFYDNAFKFIVHDDENINRAKLEKIKNVANFNVKTNMIQITKSAPVKSKIVDTFSNILHLLNQDYVDTTVAYIKIQDAVNWNQIINDLASNVGSNIEVTIINDTYVNIVDHFIVAFQSPSSILLSKMDLLNYNVDIEVSNAKLALDGNNNVPINLAQVKVLREFTNGSIKLAAFRDTYINYSKLGTDKVQGVNSESAIVERNISLSDMDKIEFQITDILGKPIGDNADGTLNNSLTNFTVSDFDGEVSNSAEIKTYLETIVNASGGNKLTYFQSILTNFFWDKYDEADHDHNTHEHHTEHTVVAAPSVTDHATAWTDLQALKYIASNVSLIPLLGANIDAAKNHYNTQGYDTGLNFNGFNPVQYLANYPDLTRIFNDDLEAATRHYIVTGQEDGRTDSL